MGSVFAQFFNTYIFWYIEDLSVKRECIKFWEKTVLHSAFHTDFDHKGQQDAGTFCSFTFSSKEWWKATYMKKTVKQSEELRLFFHPPQVWAAPACQDSRNMEKSKCNMHLSTKKAACKRVTENYFPVNCLPLWEVRYPVLEQAGQQARHPVALALRGKDALE